MANPYFNAAYYLQHNPDVKAAGYTLDTAEQHYLQYGANEALMGAASRKPTPYFDVKYYLLNNPDLIVAGLGPTDAFQHFVQYGQFEQRSPAQGLIITDAKLSVYAANNPDLRDAFDIEDSSKLSQEQKDDLISHFYRYGYKEDRPGAPFDPYHPPGPDPDPTPDPVPDPPQLFTLTADTDTFKGGSADDTFQGMSSHLNLFDNLDGGGGNNILKLLADDAPEIRLMAAHTTIPLTVTVKNIQTIGLYANDDGTAPYSLIDAARFQGATEIWQIGGAGVIENLQDNQIAGFRDTTDEDEVTILADPVATSMGIVLDSVGRTNVIEVAAVSVSAQGENVASLSLSGSIGSGVGYTVLGLKALPSNITTLALSLETDSFIQFYTAPDSTDPVLSSFAHIESISASASTGDLDFSDLFISYMSAYSDPDGIGTQMALESFASGSGDDAVQLYTGMLGADTVNFSMGAGDDYVEIYLGDDYDLPGSGTVMISGGAGADVYSIYGGGVALNKDEEFVGGVVITDFADQEDILALGPDYDGLTEQSLVDDAISAATTIEKAVANVADLIGDGGAGVTHYAAFVFDENTYLYGDIDGLLPQDNMLIQLSGIVKLDDSNVVDYEPCGCGGIS